eukprot:TRINITY_DN76304_c0_g1_i1.p2 TRINITY_DN76304_c0_g1~~TRINITY_DN76304_c0_g1_i1.p2  ORF type:complete len:111 (-),score=18.27 TRINITY_DN76304_c0_g1_i1:259-591(-)
MPVAPLQSLVGQVADKADGVCDKLPQVFGSMDKVPPLVLEQCKKVGAVKSMTTASSPDDICKSLDAVFGGRDKAPKEILEKCNQLDAMKGAMGGFGGIASGLPGGLPFSK